MIILEDEKMANTKKRLVGVTVVSADCCTSCVLDHMKAAVRNKKEQETYERFLEADTRFVRAQSDYDFALRLLKRSSEVLFNGDELGEIESLCNELEITSFGLPKLFCLPF